MTRAIWMMGAVGLALAGCTEAIQMKNPTPGAVATCGNHSLFIPIYATIASTHDHECVQDYKDQGYVRSAAN